MRRALTALSLVAFFMLMLMGPAPASAQLRLPTGRPPMPAPGEQTGQTGSARPFTTRNWIDFGGRATDIDGDRARFQRYRDLGDGAVVDVFRWARETDQWSVDAGADHVGRRDQRYVLEYDRFGKVRASFSWNQIPLFVSGDTATLYSTESPGVLRIDDAIQRGIENGLFTIRDVVDQVVGFETRSQRDIARFALELSATPELDLTLELTTTKRDGTLPWGASFGFSNAVEVAAPLETRTTDLSAAAEWAKNGGLVRVGYDGSWFDNDIQTLIWDNPIRFTDQTYDRAYSVGDGTSQGRMALWPSNTLHTVSAFGSTGLPGRSRASAYLAVSSSRQDELILPHTINSAIPEIPLDRGSAGAEFRAIATNLSFVTRPTRYLSFDARYRVHDLDSRTPAFHAHEYVRFDQVVEEAEAHDDLDPHSYSIARQDLDLTATLRPMAYTGVRVGYRRIAGDRTARHFLTTVEDIFHTSVDFTGNRYVTFRTSYEHGAREGSDFAQEFLDAVGEQPGLRHYDIANRNRDRVTAHVTVTPVGSLGVTASVAAGQDDYPDSQFGLSDNDHRIYTVSLDANPHDTVQFGASFGLEQYNWLGRSRNASPGDQFDDPTRDWSTDSDDTVHSAGAYVDLLRLFPDTEIRANYDFSRSRSVYTYGLAPDTTLGSIEQLPRVFSEVHGVMLDSRYFLSERVAIGLVYLFETYDVEDFALGGGIISGIALPQVEPGEPLVPTTGILLNYLYRPYTAHSAWLRLTYLW